MDFLQIYIQNLMETNFANFTVTVCKDPILFGDYRTAMDESEPRVYEDIIDYDSAKALFIEVRVYRFSYPDVSAYRILLPICFLTLAMSHRYIRCSCI